jgi:hypothetical protein
MKNKISKHKNHDVDMVVIVERRYNSKDGKRKGTIIKRIRWECNTCGEIFDDTISVGGKKSYRGNVKMYD